MKTHLWAAYTYFSDCTAFRLGIGMMLRESMYTAVVSTNFSGLEKVHGWYSPKMSRLTDWSWRSCVNSLTENAFLGHRGLKWPLGCSISSSPNTSMSYSSHSILSGTPKNHCWFIWCSCHDNSRINIIRQIVGLRECLWTRNKGKQLHRKVLGNLSHSTFVHLHDLEMYKNNMLEWVAVTGRDSCQVLSLSFLFKCLRSSSVQLSLSLSLCVVGVCVLSD